MWKIFQSIKEGCWEVGESISRNEEIHTVIGKLFALSINPAIATTIVCSIIVLLWTHGDSKKKYYKFIKASLLPCLSLLMTKCIFALYFYYFNNTVTPCFVTEYGIFKEIAIFCILIDIVLLIHPLFSYVNPTTEPENKFKSFKILFLTVFGYLAYCITVYPIICSKIEDDSTFGNTKSRDVLLSMKFETALLVFLYVSTIFGLYLTFQAHKDQPKAEIVWKFKRPGKTTESERGKQTSFANKSQ
ncbi:uncharacterized protein VICG_01072 [Vittaforma corneae ATCC 50505]|uniref:Uncharacterized protein n=1 Tax=Vittaforma corneae (strain ATCC 50505) TaxID=993615 RepID=L2GLW9_VITCO|nr:uncharacterized protein VICG_01072 [Vittaforma corneae ATCC 50505]ELA41888.1 hypothetical protein VICG_01072 [Vittaforma corneae ATCC 50505]